MRTDKEKFASQADPKILATLRQIASEEGRQFQSVLDEALRDLIEKKRSIKPRNHVLNALNDSISDFDKLYQKLAE
ncbi:MAG: hypothetical protein KAS59_05535 [Alphaproteobacteria bacterium]|nr:hypothetical protein [Alphaproteobacteria bacterium]